MKPASLPGVKLITLKLAVEGKKSDKQISLEWDQ